MTFADDEESGRDEEQSAEAETPDVPAEDAAAEPDASATEGTESETVAEPGDVADSPDEPEAAAEPEAEEPAAEPEEEAPAEPATDGEEPAAEAEEGAPAEPEAEAKEPAAAAPAREDKPKDVVPGADLEPIAINEERELTAEERARAEAEAEERAAREARSTAEDDDEEVAERTVSVPADARIQATGKRKSAVARVIVRSGSGEFQVNDRSLEEYFPSSLHQSQARQALVSSGYDGSVDVRVRVHGGGISGQAGAVRHGVARALTSLEPELRGDLKRRGMLTRDDRRKERKKAGLKKARKRPQFSKR